MWGSKPKWVEKYGSYLFIITNKGVAIIFDENQIVKVKWHSANKQYFQSIGIDFTKIGDTFEVPAKLLPPKSSSKVKCICDYCGELYETTYAIYNKSKDRGKLSCSKCKEKKKSDTFMQRYGVTSPGASDFCREKAKIAMKERYGCEYAMQSQGSQEKFKHTMEEKYGANNPAKCPELLYKARVSAYNNGSVNISKPEKQIVNMLVEIYGNENCFPSYSVDRVNLDCLLIVNGVKIDVEYDGLYWHQETKDKDRKRNHWLMSNGYKVLRILGNPKDDIPTKDQLINEVEYLLNGHSIGYINMNK